MMHYQDQDSRDDFNLSDSDVRNNNNNNNSSSGTTNSGLSKAELRKVRIILT